MSVLYTFSWVTNDQEVSHSNHDAFMGASEHEAPVIRIARHIRRGEPTEAGPRRRLSRDTPSWFGARRLPEYNNGVPRCELDMRIEMCRRIARSLFYRNIIHAPSSRTTGDCV
jgi:hypothetical protein